MKFELRYERIVVSVVCLRYDSAQFRRPKLEADRASRPTTLGNFDAQSWTPFYEVS